MYKAISLFCIIKKLLPFVVLEFRPHYQRYQLAALIEQPCIQGASIVSTETLDF